MLQKENIIMPLWFLERIEDTLRIQNNINLDKKTGETCQDRNVKESLNGVRKLLRGEELIGGERLERLQPPLILSGGEQREVDLDAEIEKELRTHYNDDQDVYWWNYLKNSFRHFYELGLKARKEEMK